MENAALEWEGLFKHSALGRNARYSTEYHRPLDLIKQRLAMVDVIPTHATRH